MVVKGRGGDVQLRGLSNGHMIRRVLGDLMDGSCCSCPRTMLSTSTKQINAYGKRSKRVIDAPITGEAAKPVPSTLVRIFDDLPPPSTKSGLASRMKKRENKLPSPKPVGKLQAKKKRISPISPFKRPNRVTQLVQEDLAGNTNSPTRAPLSSFSVNIPASPAVMPSLKQKAAVRAAPVKLAKPKEVNMDIILLDDEGHTVGKERRVSRTGATVKPAKVAPNTHTKAPPKPIVYVDSDCEEVPSHPVPPKRSQKRRPVVASDSESDSDVQPLSCPPSPLPRKKSANQVAKQLQRLPRVEVVIPPAPYRLPTSNKDGKLPAATSKPPTQSIPPKAALPPKVEPATAHPKPKPAPALVRPPPAFQLPPSPIQKARPLTPIRGRRKGLFDPPSPPSPSLSDCDLSLDFSELAIDDGSQGFTHVEQDIPAHLLPLLEECGQEQCGPHDFSSFIDTFAFDPILQGSRSTAFGDLEFRKIGEASYSEVFGIGDVVLKVIPLRDESRKAQSSSKSQLEDEGPPPSDAQDVRKEIIVTRAMGEVYGGFVKFLKTYIVKGKYPSLLLQLWDEYDKSKGSESIRPGISFASVCN
jgi:serine/threonine-protein kinase haspin